MNAKLKSLLQQLLRSPQRFPVEAALGLVFFVIAVLSIENKLWSGVSKDILLFFIPLVVFSFWLQRINRWAYYVSFFIFMPCKRKACITYKYPPHSKEYEGGDNTS